MTQVAFWSLLWKLAKVVPPPPPLQTAADKPVFNIET